MKYLSICISISFLGCKQSNENYVISDFEFYTQLTKNQYQIETLNFKNNQSLIHVRITNAAKINLLKNKRFYDLQTFKSEYKQSGSVPFKLMDLQAIKDTSYAYFISNGKPMYEYYFIILSKKSDKMIFGENFRETQPSIF